MTPFPAPNRLHVWWARRPLVVSRAAVLASLLPADADREKFLHVLGIHGDPVEAKRKIDIARRTKNRVENPYDYEQFPLKSGQIVIVKKLFVNMLNTVEKRIFKPDFR